jgi:hypothetical protein
MGGTEDFRPMGGTEDSTGVETQKPPGVVPWGLVVECDEVSMRTPEQARSDGRPGGMFGNKRGMRRLQGRSTPPLTIHLRLYGKRWCTHRATRRPRVFGELPEDWTLPGVLS